MDLAARIEQLDRMVREAKAMPLSSSVLVNRDELIELVGQMRDALPEEIKQARWVVRDREELLNKARQEGDEIIEQARAEQLKMAEQEEIVKRAHEEAARVLGAAQDAAMATRRDAEDYVDQKLAQFEIVMGKVLENLREVEAGLAKTLGQVGHGRETLKSGIEAAPDDEARRPPFDEEAP
jgi:F0F1-type ATP synthase membrane subunit b/b'